MDFQKAFDAGFDAIKGYVDRSFATVFGRIKALEERAPERGEKGADGKDGAQGERGPEGPAGKDGRSAVKFLVDQGGELVGTFTDGTVERLGVVKGSDGKDGAPGRDGKDGRDGIDGAPGTNGKDGADGFGFDDLDFEHDGARGFSFKFVRGDKVKTFSFTVPAMIYRGVYAATAEYERGDVVTFGGSTWHCNDNTADKPDGVNKAWTLVVKKGRDGKDGLAGEKGERGAEGRPGRDLTQLGADGAKW
jgi:hypothetical protein